MSHEYVCNNNVITDMNVIANEFKKYFVSICYSLSEKIQSVHSSEEYLGQIANSVFKFTEVNEDCIDKNIKKLKSKSSPGYDNISNKLIKHARTVLVKPLTLLANQIIHTGEFPRQLKIARVKPLFCILILVHVTRKQQWPTCSCVFRKLRHGCETTFFS